MLLQKTIEGKAVKYIHKHFSKKSKSNILKLVNRMHAFNHKLLHMNELILVVGMGFAGLMFASFSSTQNTESLYRSNYDEVKQHLQAAMEKPKTSIMKGNIISIRDLDSSIDNSFAKGYCTYGAARISPEFFPYITPTQQQRTRGGNAVDRCTNAQAAGYRIGSTPTVGSLVVYGEGFGAYGHVSKVLYTNKELGKMILRDMSWIARYKMTDRRETITNGKIKCVIYNNQPAKEITVVVENTGSTVPVTTGAAINTGTIVTGNIVTGTVLTGIVVTTTGSETKPATGGNIVTNTTTVVTNNNTPNTTTTKTGTNNTNTGTNTGSNPKPIEPQVPPVNTGTTLPTPPVVVDDGIAPVKTELNYDKIDDPVINHFLSQYTLEISSKLGNKDIKVGQKEIVTIKIKDKSGQYFEGILPFSFNLIASNGNIAIRPSYIQLISNSGTEIEIVGENVGKTSIIINLGDYKIGQIHFTVVN